MSGPGSESRTVEQPRRGRRSVTDAQPTARIKRKARDDEPERQVSAPGASGITVLTPEEAMHLAELATTRKFMPLTLVVAVVGLVALGVMPATAPPRPSPRQGQSRRSSPPSSGRDPTA